MSVTRHKRRRTAGFTLVEMLVSLVITSVGLLGVAKLALGTVQANDSALMRSQATVLMQQIIENMRANRTLAVTTSNYNIAVGVTPAGSGIAVTDLAAWKAALAAELPSGDGSVTITQETNPATGGFENVAVVTVQWDDSVAETSFGAAAGIQSISAETML